MSNNDYYIFKTTGTIIFDPPDVTRKHEKQSSWKKTVIVMIDCPDFCPYYSWFVMKRYNLELLRPLRGTHFTIINDKISDSSEYEHAKSIYNKKTISIEYGVDLRTDDISWWVGAKSDDAEKIRIECGLPPKPYWGFHITVGRVDGDLRIAHSKYIHHLIKTFGKEYL